MKVRDAMTAEVISCKRDWRISQVIHLLAQHHLEGVPVVDDNGELVGMVSERDILYRAFPDYVHAGSNTLRGLSRADVLKLRNLDLLSVSSLAAKPSRTVSPDDELHVAAQLMVERGLSLLPVVEGKKMVGLLSRREVMAGLLR